MNGAPCLIKQQCPEAHVELMGKSYIHPLDVDVDDDVFFCLRPPTPPLPPFNSVSNKEEMSDESAMDHREI